MDREPEGRSPSRSPDGVRGRTESRRIAQHLPLPPILCVRCRGGADVKHRRSRCPRCQLCTARASVFFRKCRRRGGPRGACPVAVGGTRRGASSFRDRASVPSSVTSDRLYSTPRQGERRRVAYACSTGCARRRRDRCCPGAGCCGELWIASRPQVRRSTPNAPSTSTDRTPAIPTGEPPASAV